MRHVKYSSRKATKAQTTKVYATVEHQNSPFDYRLASSPTFVEPTPPGLWGAPAMDEIVALDTALATPAGWRVAGSEGTGA